jgi:dipeptidyl aminopeptidase/acylaminoacyl peptidase
MQKQNNIYFVNNEGDSPEGKYPYLSKFNLKTKENKIIYKSQSDSFETIEAVLNEELSKILINHQSKTEPENYYLVNLKNNSRKKITNYKNPYPKITNSKQEIIRYNRKDGVSLTGKLYLPPGYENKKRLPLIVWAYPLEYKSKKVAGQLKSSPNKFMKFWGASIKYLLLEGYAVVDASVPIVGDPETVNNTFVEQTVDSVKAVIDYLDKREIVDPKRVCIAGHSYGAFMVANVLAHSDICKIGIARSGAYNRSLTPFGFQHEQRTLWEATQFYIDVSPYFHAEKLKEPLLMIHGLEDPNSGTYPLQTKRMYQAIKGTGGTAKMVLLPKEGHGYRARKSNLHVIAEMIEWCNKYLKK